MQQVVHIGLFSVAETQTSDASHSTTNGWRSSMDWSVVSQVPSSVGQRQIGQIHPVGRMQHSQEAVSCQRSLVSTSHSKQTCPPLYGESRHLLEEDSPGGGEVAPDLV